MNVKGKVVIVTASTRGIGWACVQAFVREGAIVYLAARNEEAAKKRIEELSGEPGQAKWVYCDASVKESSPTHLWQRLWNRRRDGLTFW